jgi:hypothetical protein
MPETCRPMHHKEDFLAGKDSACTSTGSHFLDVWHESKVDNSHVIIIYSVDTLYECERDGILKLRIVDKNSPHSAFLLKRLFVDAHGYAAVVR